MGGAAPGAAIGSRNGEGGEFLRSCRSPAPYDFNNTLNLTVVRGEFLRLSFVLLHVQF